MRIDHTTGNGCITSSLYGTMPPVVMMISRILSVLTTTKPSRPKGSLDRYKQGSDRVEKLSCEPQTLEFTKTIDLTSSPAVRKRLLSALARHQHLIIDFTHLPYIDSAGIAVFLEALNIAKQEKRSMVFIGVQGPALQLMQLTRLNKVFTLMDAAPHSMA